MTLREYVKKNFPSYYEYVETCDYTELVPILFYSRYYIQTEKGENFYNTIAYSPFDYEGETSTSYGGFIVNDIVQYIFENYIDNDINEIFQYVSQTEEDKTPLKDKLLMLRRKYAYKWHGLFELTQLDEAYDPLDNVNEISTETTIRTPNLSHTQTESNVYGATQKTINDEIGSKTDSETNKFGQRNRTLTDTVNGYEDKHEHEFEPTETTTDNKVFAYNDNVNGSPTSSSTVKTITRNDVDTDTFGSRTETHRNVENSHTDTKRSTYGSQSNSSTIAEVTHTDTHNNSELETGNERTEYIKNRHGNIGVTTSAQLIDGDRKIHYFELVSIIANDIINEILDLNFWC